MGLKITASGASHDQEQQEQATQRGPRRIPQGTQQQETFWSELASGKTHVLAEARAGCAKSTSCREGMWRMLERHSTQRIRYAVYNKANAEEFRADCPPGVDVGTCHAFGYAALRRAFNSRADKLKSYMVMDELRSTKHLQRYWRKSIAMLVGAAKNQFATPSEAQLAALLDHYDINYYGRRAFVAGCAAEVLKRSASWTEVVDFDDMLHLPVLHQVDFPHCDVLFIDECQDWSPIMHDMIGLICSTGRIVATGDRFQAVYAWRGAAPDSIPNLEYGLKADSLGLTSFPLTITFRCPKSHVAEANRYVPDLLAHESNGEGTILRGVSLDDCLAQLVPGDRVICPTNAPVIRLALRLVGERRKAFVRGRAIGEQLLDVVRGAGECRTIAVLGAAVDNWRSRELTRLAEREGVEDLEESVIDRAAGLHAVLSCCDSPAEAPGVIADLFSEADQAEAVNLSTVHRAKGLESERVWFLDVPTRTPTRGWEVQQAINLRYVAVTRSKNFLAYVVEERKPQAE